MWWRLRNPLLNFCVPSCLDKAHFLSSKGIYILKAKVSILYIHPYTIVFSLKYVGVGEFTSDIVKRFYVTFKARWDAAYKSHDVKRLYKGINVFNNTEKPEKYKIAMSQHVWDFFKPTSHKITWWQKGASSRAFIYASTYTYVYIYYMLIYIHINYKFIYIYI